MATEKFMCRCETCGANFQFGPHRYDGKVIPTYKISVCMACWNANWDGWAPHLEAKVTAKLRSEGLSLPARNPKNLLPRE